MSETNGMEGEKENKEILDQLASPLVVFGPRFQILPGTRVPVMSIVKDSMECTRETGCEEVDEKDINMSTVLKVDFDEKKIKLISSDTGERVSEIENRKQIDGKLIVQGAEDGYEEYQDGSGWSMSIMESNGDMVLSASGDNVAFVLFGECVPASYMN